MSDRTDELLELVGLGRTSAINVLSSCHFNVFRNSVSIRASFETCPHNLRAESEAGVMESPIKELLTYIFILSGVFVKLILIENDDEQRSVL